MSEEPMTSPPAGGLNAPREHLVILVHGIRDFGFWSNELKSELRQAGFSVESAGYRWFDVVSFLWPSRHFRREIIDAVWGQVQDAVGLHKGADVSFIAHSFGTYVVAHMLEQQHSFQPYRLIFCGSVLPRDFKFQLLRDRIAQMRSGAGGDTKERLIVNEVGTRDVWPAVAESITFGYGSAGTYGFNTPGVEDRFHRDVDHGSFLNRDFTRKFWVPFLRDGTVVEADSAAPPPLWLRLLTWPIKLRWIIIAALVMLVTWLALVLFFRPAPVSVELDPQAPLVQRAADVMAARPVVPADQIVAPEKVQFMHWAGAMSQFQATLNAECPLPFGLCAISWLQQVISGRSYGTDFTVGSTTLYDVVSCDNFRQSEQDPMRLLESFVGTFPQCVKIDRGPTGLVTLLPDIRLHKVERPGSSPAYLCGCDEPFVTEFIRRLGDAE